MTELAISGNCSGNRWQLVATALPFSVTPFRNTSGTTSFRVSGSWEGERIRKNFADRASADAFCNAKNAAALKAETTVASRLVQTRLAPDDIHAVESAIDRIAKRWPLRAVLAAGIASLEAHPTSESVETLAEEWLTLIEEEVSPRWLKDLRRGVRKFTADNPALRTDGWTQAVTRRWLDGISLAKQTKANLRNAVHRFGNWVVERGFLRDNPASGIRISNRLTGAQQADRSLPTVFTPAQTEALLRACELGSCRRVLGWMAGCLFTGVRPESEAPRLTWAEVNFATAELSLMGRKRGAKPRIVKLQPAALAWLRAAKADEMEKPMLYSRRLKRRAVELANAALAEKHPEEKPIVWDEDISRHTFASYRSPQIPVHELAAEMGNSPGTIYGHYRHPQAAAAVKAFWAIRPT